MGKRGRKKLHVPAGCENMLQYKYRSTIPTGLLVKQFIDMDYWSKLSSDDKKYLKKFIKEYYYHQGTLSDLALHRTTKQKQQTRAEWASVNKCLPLAACYYPDTFGFFTPSPEDAYIEKLDIERDMQKKKFHKR